MKNSHALYEDVFALTVGVLMLSFSLVMVKQADVVTGGVAGLALLLSRLSDMGFGVLFFALCAPFYVMAWFRMSRAFAIKSLLTSLTISYLTEVLTEQITFASLPSFWAATIGGVLCGTGLLILFRHQSSAGGFNVLALYCQEHFGIRAGNLQLGLDLLILLATALLFDVHTLAASALCMVVLNVLLSFNHRPDRYQVVRTAAS